MSDAHTAADTPDDLPPHDPDLDPSSLTPDAEDEDEPATRLEIQGWCATCGGPMEVRSWDGAIHVDEMGYRDEAADLDHQAALAGRA